MKRPRGRHGPVRLYSGGGGCLTVMLAVILLLLWIGIDDPAGLNVPLDSQYADPRGPRRPLPDGLYEEFIINDAPRREDSQGTAFAIDSDGIWATAEHVSGGCKRLALVEGRSLGPVERALNSSGSDTALLIGGPTAEGALPVAAGLPQRGETGYHMGFPSGSEGMVTSSYMGSAIVRRSGGGSEPVLVWAERSRDWISVEPLGGISGGPTLLTDGRVIGINSAASDRRGRVLTTAPGDLTELIAVDGTADERPRAQPLPGRSDALRRFAELLKAGLIRMVYCDV